MSDLGAFAWIVLGAASGWVISRLMVRADDDALRGTAAGTVGGILRGLGMRLLDSSPGLAAMGRHPSLGSRVQALAERMRAE